MWGRCGRAEPSGSRPSRTRRSPAASLKPPPSQRGRPGPSERSAHARRRSEEAVSPMPLIPNSGDHASSLPSCTACCLLQTRQRIDARTPAPGPQDLNS